MVCANTVPPGVVDGQRFVWHDNGVADGVRLIKAHAQPEGLVLIPPANALSLRYAKLDLTPTQGQKY